MLKIQRLRLLKIYEVINGSENAGVMSVNKNTVGGGKVTIINQSVTGLFETREEI